MCRTNPAVMHDVEDVILQKYFPQLWPRLPLQDLTDIYFLERQKLQVVLRMLLFRGQRLRFSVEERGELNPGYLEGNVNCNRTGQVSGNGSGPGCDTNQCSGIVLEPRRPTDMRCGGGKVNE